MTPTIQYTKTADYKSIVARRSFYWYDKDTDLKRHVFAAHASCIIYFRDKWTILEPYF